MNLNRSVTTLTCCARDYASIRDTAAVYKVLKTGTRRPCARLCACVHDDRVRIASTDRQGGRAQDTKLTYTAAVYKFHGWAVYTAGVYKLQIVDIIGSSKLIGRSTGAALLDNNEATSKSTSQNGGMVVNFG